MKAIRAGGRGTSAARRTFPVVGLALALVFTGLLRLWLAWSAYDSYRELEEFSQLELRAEHLNGKIHQFDEVLTMSARMAAATGDSAWADRYARVEPQLDAAIKEVSALAPGDMLSDAAKVTDDANIALVGMEHAALDAVRKGDRETATQILFGAEYERQKQIHAQGTAESRAATEVALDARLDGAKRVVVTSAIIAVVILASSVAAWRVAVKNLRRWQRDLEEENEHRARAEAELQAARDGLERRVVERTAELAEANEALSREMDAAERQRSIISRQERLTALGTLVAGVAHEINNPLTYMRGSLELARLERDQPTGDSNGEIDRRIVIALGGMDRIEAIVKALRVVARTDQGRRQRVDLVDVVRDVMTLIEAAGPPSVHVVASTVATEPVGANATELNQVLLNLVRNAVDTVGETGCVRVAVDLDDDTVVVSVEDDGKGLPAHVKATLFTPFQTTKPNGTGPRALHRPGDREGPRRSDRHRRPPGGRHTGRVPSTAPCPSACLRRR